MNLAKMRVRTLLYSGFGAVLTILLLLQGVSHFNLTKLNTSSDWNNHTYDVIISVDAILTSLVNIETGQRGFIITGKDTSLEPLKSGAAAFADQLRKARTLTADNQSQQARFGRLEQLQRQWMATGITPLIDMRRKVNEGAETSENLIALESEGKGKRDMDAMRTLLAEIRADEARLLKERSTDMLAQEEQTKITLWIGSALGLAIGLGMALLIVRTLNRQLGGEPVYAAAIASQIAAGDLTVNV